MQSFLLNVFIKLNSIFDLNILKTKMNKILFCIMKFIKLLNTYDLIESITCKNKLLLSELIELNLTSAIDLRTIINFLFKIKYF
jgi:hypothetical protein